MALERNIRDSTIMLLYFRARLLKRKRNICLPVISSGRAQSTVHAQSKRKNVRRESWMKKNVRKGKCRKIEFEVACAKKKEKNY